MGSFSGAAIRAARQARGWTQRQLAEAAGLSEIAIKRLEGGKNTPSGESLQRLAGALGVSTDTLMGRDDPLAGPLPVATLRALGVDERRFPLYRRKWDRESRDWRLKFLGTLRMRAIADATLTAMTEEIEAEISTLEDQIEELDEPGGEAPGIQQRVAV